MKRAFLVLLAQGASFASDSPALPNFGMVSLLERRGSLVDVAPPEGTLVRLRSKSPVSATTLKRMHWLVQLGPEASAACSVAQGASIAFGILAVT